MHFGLCLFRLLLIEIVRCAIGPDFQKVLCHFQKNSQWSGFMKLLKWILFDSLHLKGMITLMKNIEFVSTRNGDNKMSFWESLIKGLSDDGGLLVPTSFPKISDKLLTDKKWWVKSTPADFAFNVLRIFIPASEISDKDLKTDIDEALNFPMPLEKLSGNDLSLIHI